MREVALILASGAACIWSVDGRFALPSFKFNVRGVAAAAVAATTFQLPLLSPSFHPPTAQAAVNQLADVGLKEFLVKDGRQFLRLAIPIG
jgi:hypothetical protein